jgi:DNA-binding transcriptional LysR family regulator
MEEKDWNMLKTLYVEKSITRTAEKLYISQPAITYRIKQIEKEFGTKIIIRGKKGVEFTSQGDHLVNYSKQMLTKLKQTKEKIQKMDNKIQGTLRLGVSSNFAQYKLPPLLKNFLDQYPDVEFNVKTGWSNEVIQLLQREDVHMGIVRGDHNWPDEKHLLYEEPLCIAAKYPIKIEELPFLGRINYKTGIHLKNTIENWWQSQFTQPPLITMEVDKLETCKEMVKNGLGYGIFPSMSIREDKDLYQQLLTENKGTILRKTWLLYRKSSLELVLIKAFAKFLTNSYADATGNFPLKR